MTILDQVQDLDIKDSSGNPEGLVELFDIYLPGETTAIHLTNGFDLADSNNTITFDGNSYVAIPIQIEGIEATAAGAANRPTLSVANIASISRTVLAGERDSSGNWVDPVDEEDTLFEIIRDIGLTKNEDLIGTKVVYRVTLTSRIDNVVADEFPAITYYIDRVAQEDHVYVNFELAHSFDIEGAVIPHRTVIGRYCPWEYQGWNKASKGGCTWPLNNNLGAGDRILATDDSIIASDFSGINQWSDSDTTVTAGNIRYTTDTVGGINDFKRVWKALRAVPAGTGHPEKNKYFWTRHDGCGKLISSCKLRYQYVGVDANNDDILDKNRPMAFGGFPGVRTFK